MSGDPWRNLPPPTTKNAASWCSGYDAALAKVHPLYEKANANAERWYALAEALVDYGGHAPLCGIGQINSSCDCGWSDLLVAFRVACADHDALVAEQDR